MLGPWLLLAIKFLSGQSHGLYDRKSPCETERSGQT